MLRRGSTEEWSALLAEQGVLRQREFCAKHDLSLSTFQYWRHRKSKKHCDSAAKISESFLPFEVVGSAAPTGAEGERRSRSPCQAVSSSGCLPGPSRAPSAGCSGRSGHRPTVRARGLARAQGLLGLTAARKRRRTELPDVGAPSTAGARGAAV